MTEPRLVVRWRGLLEPSIDLFSAVVTFGWAALCLGANDFFSRSPGYAAMAELAPARVWGAFLLVSGLVQLVGITIRRPPTRLVAQTGAAALWTFIAVMVSQASVGGIKTGAVVYGCLATFLFVRTLRPESR